jgi:hypothetical protein
LALENNMHPDDPILVHEPGGAVTKYTPAAWSEHVRGMRGVDVGRSFHVLGRREFRRVK